METTSARPFLSVATPAHNEIEALPEFHRRVRAMAESLGVEWEWVVADDGSTDGTRDLLREMAAADPHLKAVLLSRNFGHTPAYMAALEHASGDWVVVMDSDLQDEPEAIPLLLERAEQEGAEVVYAIKRRRPEGPLMRLAFASYYRLAGRVSETPQPAHAGPFCLLSRKACAAIGAFGERSLYFPGVRSYVGFRQTGLKVDRGEREGGRSRIPLRRRLSGAFDGLFAFSTAPLRFASLLGITVAFITGLLELFFLYFKLFTDVPVQGFTALITAILFIGGIQLLTVGIIGEYLGRVYEEVKGRPRYVVEERINVAEPDAGRLAGKSS